jgi:hypothetical protein
VTVVEGLIFPDLGDTVVVASGAAAWIMHSSDSYWFSASESPTNITFFPDHIRSSANPSNLRTRAIQSQTRAILISQSGSRRRPDGMTTTNLGGEQGGLGSHRYRRYPVSGRPKRRQSNSARMKGQLAESYSGYASSATQLPANMSHDPGADFWCWWCFREMVIAAAAAAAVHAARSAATMAAAIAARRVMAIPILARRAMGVRLEVPFL